MFADISRVRNSFIRNSRVKTVNIAAQVLYRYRCKQNKPVQISSYFCVMVARCISMITKKAAKKDSRPA